MKRDGERDPDDFETWDMEAMFAGKGHADGSPARERHSAVGPPEPRLGLPCRTRHVPGQAEPAGRPRTHVEGAGRFGDRAYEAYPHSPKALVGACGAAT